MLRDKFRIVLLTLVQILHKLVKFTNIIVRIINLTNYQFTPLTISLNLLLMVAVLLNSNLKFTNRIVKRGQPIELSFDH